MSQYKFVQALRNSCRIQFALQVLNYVAPKYTTLNQFMGKKTDFSENSIYTHYILPALIKAGWDLQKQIRENVYFTDGRIYVNGKKTTRGERKFADVILYYKSNIPIAIIEIKKTPWR
jgi:type I site-specific restriction endonuclease